MNLTDTDLERLQTIGWHPGLEPALRDALVQPALDSTRTRLALLRLVEIHRDGLRLHDGRAMHAARAAPRLLRELAGQGAELAVGDWVLAAAERPGAGREAADRHAPERHAAERDAAGPHAGPLWVQARLAPRHPVVRRDADGRRHVLASHVDSALFVMGLDADFNLRRIERYLMLVAGSGIEPVVVLTKADLIAPDPAAREAVVADEIDALRARLGAGVPVLALDGRSPDAAVRLAPWLAPGRTVVLLGSSGTGKSTLTNTLAARSLRDTGPVRVHDQRGRHTTTSRTLHRLPGGACVIDTPGLRALRPDLDEATLAAGFEDIARLAPLCRFRDCRHAGERGCAVGAAVPPERVRNYHKLLREARRDTLGALERQRQLAQWKARGRAGEQRARMKRGGL